MISPPDELVELEEELEEELLLEVLSPELPELPPPPHAEASTMERVKKVSRYIFNSGFLI